MTINYEKKYNSVYYTEGSYGKVTVVQFQPFVDQNHYHTRGYVHEERSKTDSDNIFYQHAFQSVNTAAEM